ncbi:unnamed protein product [Nippostrongylus brasiliensis]|uniref:C2 domain-containing protein n=1 Tax=Nippostrongylus brasiliensis TaxID=27835 RepID=A0A0N4XLT7_NIPBR|nr:unnamed protein product [Nippostrongylus brasiliensis]
MRVSRALFQAGLSPSMHRVSNGSVASGDSRRNSMVDACGRFCSQPTNGAPELLIALCYDTDHGCLTVGIERGSSLGEKTRPTDTFIKIVVLGEFGNELWRQKTELVKGCSEPQYDHSASIQVRSAWKFPVYGSFHRHRAIFYHFFGAATVGAAFVT